MRYDLALATGLGLAGLGLLLLARAPVDGSYVVDVLPSMILLGLGAGMAFNPVLLAAMSDVEPQESGLASGIVNTSFMMGGALGLAILASVAASMNERSPRWVRATLRRSPRLPRGVPDRGAVRSSAPRRSAASSFECAGDGARRRRGGYRGGLTLREPARRRRARAGSRAPRGRLGSPRDGPAACDRGVRVLTCELEPTYWSSSAKHSSQPTSRSFGPSSRPRACVRARGRPVISLPLQSVSTERPLSSRWRRSFPRASWSVLYKAPRGAEAVGEDVDRHAVQREGDEYLPLVRRQDLADRPLRRVGRARPARRPPAGRERGSRRASSSGSSGTSRPARRACGA